MLCNKFKASNFISHLLMKFEYWIIHSAWWKLAGDLLRSIFCKLVDGKAVFLLEANNMLIRNSFPFCIHFSVHILLHNQQHWNDFELWWSLKPFNIEIILFSIFHMLPFVLTPPPVVGYVPSGKLFNHIKEREIST